MDLKERIYSVLAVSAADAFNASLRAMLPQCRYEPVCFEMSVNAARRTLLEKHFDLVVINSPLPDDSGLRLAVDLCRQKDIVALVLVKADYYGAVYSKVAEHGVYVLAKPISKAMLSQAVDWMSTTQERLRQLEKKAASIEEKMQEIRLVNRAKWLLIDQLKMTEADAHRYIEKQAMDSCTSKKVVAEEIVGLYS